MHLSAFSACTALILVACSPCASASASCECGYTINSTTAPATAYTLFTDLFETDFLHLYTLPDSIAADSADAVGWAPQAYNVSPFAARGPYGKSAEVDNVVLNPLNSTTTWGALDGIAGGPPGLQIWVRGATNLSDYVSISPAERGKMVRVGEINSLRRDFRYGTFRIGMKMSEVPGTCAAFFWYRNNTQEIDLEYLSRQSFLSNSSSMMNLVIQSPISQALNFNAAATKTFSLHSLPFLPGSDYHEYRFDWTPTSITFYADGKLLADFDHYDPNAEGTLMLNHWSNGDGGWSGGPPATDAAITVSYIKAYFNTSDPVRNTQWQQACEGSWMGRTCEISGFPQGGISPMGETGNETGKTAFFMYEREEDVVNQTVYPAATARPGAGGRAVPQWWGLAVLILVDGLLMLL